MAIGSQVAQMFVRVGADTSGFSRGMASVEAQMQAVGKGSAGTAKRMGMVGSTLTRTLTPALLIAGAGAVGMRAKFQSSMSKITGLVGISSDKVDKMKGSVLKLAGQTAKSPVELADALFFVTSAGLRGQTALDALEVAAKGSAAGLGDTEVVADAVTSAINAYGQENLNAAQAGDILAATVREGKAEASALAPVLGNILPLASKLGVGFDEVGAAMAQQTRIGVDASTSATNMQAIFSSLLRPTTEQAEGFKKLGTSAGELRGMLGKKGLGQTLAFLQEKTGGNVAELAELFPNVRALRGVLALAANDGRDFEKVLGGMEKNQGALNDAFKAAAEDDAFKFRQAMTKLQVSMIRMGAIIAPVAVAIANGMSALADAFNSLPGPAQKVVAVILAFAAAAGPLLILAAKLVTAISTLKVAMLGLNVAFLSNPIFLVIVAIVALVAAFVIAYKKSETFRRIVDGSLRAVGKAAKWVVNAARNIISALKSVISWVRSNWKKLAVLFSGPFAPIVALATDAFGIRSALIRGVNAIISWVRSNWKKVAALIPGPWQPLVILATDAFGIRSALVRAIRAITGAVKSGMSGVVKAVRSAIGKAKGAAVAVAKAIINGVLQVNTLGAQLLGKLLGAIGSAISGAAGLAFSLATGIGRAIVNGALSGMGGLAGALRSKAQGAIRSALSNLSPFSPIEHGAAKLIGEPIVKGAVKGAKSLEAKLGGIISQQIRDVILQARSDISGLGGDIASALGQAIDKQTGRKLAVLGDSEDARRIRAIEKELSEEDAAREEASLKDRIRTAETAEEKKEAERDLQRFYLNAERDRLAESLANQQAAIEDEAAARKANLEQGIADLTDALNRGNITREEFEAAFQKLLQDQAPEYQHLGDLLGSAFANGFTDAMAGLMRSVALVAGFGGLAGIPGQGTGMGHLFSAALSTWKQERVRLVGRKNALTNQARGVSSPGGKTITKAEGKRIKQAANAIAAHDRKKPKRSDFPGARTGGLIRGLGGHDANLIRAMSGERILSREDNALLERGLRRMGNGGGPTTVTVIIQDQTTFGASRSQLDRAARQLKPALDRVTRTQTS